METKDRLEALFPGLRDSGYVITSPEDVRYNCVAWVAGDCDRWWWPDEDSFWPDDVAREETLAAVVSVFSDRGFDRCDDLELEVGFEKIAIFALDDGVPTHVARQLESGLWTSKLGQLHDVQHRLEDLCGAVYGVVRHLLKRARM